MNDKIIDKIKKLFALASNNPNGNEASSAMRMAKKLLDKHNLNMYQLVEKEKVGVKIESDVNMPYVRIIYSSISMLYDVEYVLDQTGKPYSHVLIGTESNRVTASIVISFVLSSIRKETKGLGNGIRNSAASEIYRRVEEILKERNASKEEIIPGTGLIPVDASKLLKNDIKDWISKMMDNIETQKSSYRGDSRGKNIGSNINLNAQISNRKQLN